MVVGLASISYYQTRNCPGGKKLTSIANPCQRAGILCRVLVIVGMFDSETVLTIALLLPSVVAVAFLYMALSAGRSRLIQRMESLNPDYTWVGLQQYMKLFQATRASLLMSAIR